MSEHNPFSGYERYVVLEPQAPTPQNRYWLHILLFLATVFTTALAGAELMTGKSWFCPAGAPSEMCLSLEDFWGGLLYSACFLAFLTFHEFGHYFTAMYHRVKCSLPYFIPLYIPFMMMNIGSLGAVIRIRQVPKNTTQYFDIGVAGPLAGFFISLMLLIIGFNTLPDATDIYRIHPEYRLFGRVPTEEDILTKAYRDYYAELETVERLNRMGHDLPYPMEPIMIRIGNSLLFMGFEYLFEDTGKVPNHLELYHYPLLFVGFISLFFTALNLLPIGQLDGGHVIYGLFGGRIAGWVSRFVVLGLILYGGLGLLDMKSQYFFITFSLYVLYLFYIMNKLFPEAGALRIMLLALLVISFQQVLQKYIGESDTWPGWLLYSFLMVRVMGINHPPASVEQRLTLGRQIIGWLALVIFILCFSPKPISIAKLPEVPAGKITINTQKNPSTV